MYINKILNLQKYEFSSRYEIIEVILYSTVGFFMPFMLAHPQWLVGTIVNAMLISGAITVRGYKLLPIILLPSLGVLSAGIIFGKFTVFLLYMIPFIWISNGLLVLAYKVLNIEQKWNYFITLAFGSIIKSLFLFTIALILYKSGFIPLLFLTAMGMLQLVTSVTGGIVAFGFEMVKKKI